MTDPIIIQAALAQGKTFFAQQNSARLSNLQSGCNNCCTVDSNFGNVLSSLQYQVDAGLYNGTTESLFTMVTQELGDKFILPLPVNILTTYNWGYTTTDPSVNLSGVPLQFTGQFATGSTGNRVDYTQAAQQKYLVLQTDATQPVFNHYLNVPINGEGDIPDSVWAVAVIGGKRYYFTRVPYNFDINNAAITFSQNQ